MATVFLAEDLRHGRRVAIKVLRREVAAALGAERFLREIATTAALQHPHILPLFDSGEAAGLLYYVMPYVEGESLRRRLDRERQLPIPEAVRLAAEVAQALDYAHRQGILHRDIKPENILLHDGRALVADFGVALALRQAGGDRLTETGLSVGTPQYMSPEQAAAERELEARSDVYALGAVTYEMLTGEPPSTGPTAQAVIARVLTEPPRPPSRVRATIPPALEAAVLTALQKVPADRWPSAAAFGAALQGEAGSGAPVPGTERARRGARRWRVIFGAVAGIVVLAGAGLLWALQLLGDRPPPTPVRSSITLDPGVQLAVDPLPLALSADGTVLTYAGEHAGHVQLYLRPMADFASTPVPGTDGAGSPFLSPDGRWIGFFADGKLQKVARAGGAPVVLADAAGVPEGAAWGPDGTIVYAIRGAGGFRLSERGGAPVPLAVGTAPGDSAAGTATPRWPSLLPDGRHLLVTVDGEVEALDLADGQRRPLLRGSQAVFLPPDRLLYDQHEGHIMVVGFDPRRLQVTGEATPAFDAFRGPGGGAAQFAISRSGTLVYIAGGFERTLSRVDRNGRETPLSFPPRGYRFPRFSPDGRLVALTIDPRPSAIWVADLSRGQLIPLPRAGHNIGAVWAPDGTRLAFAVPKGMAWARWQGSEPPTPVVTGPRPEGDLYPMDWPADGRLLAQRWRGSRADLVRVVPGDSVLEVVTLGDQDEVDGRVSPDGRWLAFSRRVDGVEQVYVRGYPHGGTVTQASTSGGNEPHWGRDGRTLYFRQGPAIEAVRVRTGAAFAVLGPPEVLFRGDYDFSQDPNWDVGPDGQFIMVRSDPATRGQLRVVVGWNGGRE